MTYFWSLKIVIYFYSLRCSFTVPEIPLIPPFIPPNIEFMDIDSSLGEHESDMFCEHTVVSVAMDNNSFIFWEFCKCSNDTSFLCFSIHIICYARNIDGSSDMLLCIFRSTPEIDDNCVGGSFIHFYAKIMWTDCYSIFYSIIIEKGIGLCFCPYIQDSYGSDNSSNKSKKKSFHTIKKWEK